MSDVLGNPMIPADASDSLAVLDYLNTTESSTVAIAFETDDASEQAFALRKGSDLTAAIDEALDGLREDGTLAEISQTWFGEDVTQ